MIEFNHWFFVQLFNFLFILVLLYFLLFKPVLNILKERAERISNYLEESRNLQKRSEEVMAELNMEITAAKEKARNVILKFQKEGFDGQRRILEKAREKSIEIIEKTKRELRGDTEKARLLLREEAGRLSLEIAKKVLGRDL